MFPSTLACWARPWCAAHDTCRTAQAEDKSRALAALRIKLYEGNRNVLAGFLYGPSVKSI